LPSDRPPVLTPAELSLMSAKDVPGLSANGGPNGGPRSVHGDGGGWQGEVPVDPARDDR
jgi:hypothetical protein